MEMEGVCFRRVVAGLRIGGRKCSEDFSNTGINAKMEILKITFPRILKKGAKTESQIWSAVYTGGYKIIEIPYRQTEGRILLTCIDSENKTTY
jgi:hypothetical protein